MEDAFNSNYLHEIKILPEKITAYSFENSTNRTFLQFLMNDEYISHVDHSYTYQTMVKSINFDSNNTFMEISFRFSGNSTDINKYFWAIYSNSFENKNIKYFLNSSLQDTWIKLNVSLSELKSFQSINFYSKGDVKVNYLQIESIKLINSNLSQYVGTINSKIHRTILKPSPLNETLIFNQFFFINDKIKLFLWHNLTTNVYTNSNMITLNHGLSIRYDFQDVIALMVSNDSSLSLNFTSRYKGAYLQEKIVKIDNNRKEIDFNAVYNNSVNVIFINNSKSLTNGTVSVYSKTLLLPLLYYSLFSSLDNFLIVSLIFIVSSFLISFIMEHLVKNLKRIYMLLEYNVFSKFSQNRKINRNKKLFNLHDLNSIFIFLIVIFPSFILMQENFNFYTNNKIFLPNSNKIVYSAYSYEEYNAAVWLYENIDKKIYYISADPGSNYYLYGIAGIPTLDEEIKSRFYRKMFLSCGIQGLDTTYFNNLENYEYTDIILVITLRFHKWLQTDSIKDRGIVDSKWKNITFLEYIDNAPDVNLIYSNSEVYIYSFG